MAGSLDHILSHGPEAKVLTREQAARSVVVSNIAPQTPDEDIVIHFQRRKNGGGEIDYVHIPSKGTAVVTFDEDEVATRVLEHSHELHGSKLTICRFIPTVARQVFKEVEARVNFENIHLSTRQFEDILEVFKENTGMAYRKGAKNIIIITGTIDQIEAAHKLLQYLVSQKVKLEKKVTNYGDNAGIASVGMNELGNDKSNISGSNNFEVQPQFMKLLKLVCNDNLQEIEEKFCVQIECDENTSKVFITSKNASVQDHFQKGCDAFIDLYQKFVPNIGREEVGLPKGADTAFIQRAVTTTETINAMVCEKTEKTLVLYAEKKSIKSLVQSLKEELGLTNDQSSKRTKRDQDSTRRDACEAIDTSQQGQHHVLNNEVNLSLYQGDITDERVDAIVNAANDWLQHGGGVAAAIVRKGGRQIQDESNWITQQYGPLNVGCATYTSAGKLTCRYVIHTVGPEWRKHGKESSKYFLRLACIESLQIAALQLQLSSIALTAISSGIFGMPKDICAEVMFAAIEEFSSSDHAEFSTLRDVRIVIIDKPTLSVFQEEFVKRYVTHEASAEAMSTKGRSSDGEETTPQLPNSERNAYQSERNDSSISTRQTQCNDKTFSLEQRQQNGRVGRPSVPTNSEDIEKRKHSTTPDSVKENDENGKKNSPPMGQLEEQEGSRNPEVNDPTSVVDPVKSKESTKYVFSGIGRGRGSRLAAKFTGKETTGNASTGKNSSEISKGGAPPPGLDVTQEGKIIAETLNIHVEGDQKSNVDETVKAKNAEGNDESSSEDLHNVQKVQHLTNANVDYENSQIQSGNVDRADKEITAKPHLKSNTSTRENTEQHFSDKDVDADKQGPHYEIQEKDLSTPGKKGEQESDRLAEPTVNDNIKTKSSQDEMTSETAKEEIQSQRKLTLQSDSSTSCPNPSSEQSFSPQEVTEVSKDTVGERKNDEDSRSENPFGGPPPLCEGENDHQSEPKCVMCMNLNNDPVFLRQCGRNHYYCKSCKDFLDSAGICPKCRADGLPQGNQPIGGMRWMMVPDSSLPGYDNCGVIAMHFHFHDGIQGPGHPNPGQPYNALRTTAFLPLNSDGKEVCILLRMAFDARVLFAIGKSPTTEEKNKIIWNGVELKTSQSGGSASYGYPDPSYIDRVKMQLAEKGIRPSQE